MGPFGCLEVPGLISSLHLLEFDGLIYAETWSPVAQHAKSTSMCHVQSYVVGLGLRALLMPRKPPPTELQPQAFGKALEH